MVGRKEMSFDFFTDLPKFDQAICATVEDKDFFFPDGRINEAERLPELRRLCGSCIHEKDCLDYALNKQMPYGFWGGKTPKERESIAISKDNSLAFKGMALQIYHLKVKGLSANEIAAQLGTSAGYVRRVFHKLDATEKGAEPLHQQTKDLSKGLD